MILSKAETRWGVSIKSAKGLGDHGVSPGNADT